MLWIAIFTGIGVVWHLGARIINNRQELKVIEAKKQSQLAIDAQRYEKIREIMTDSIIDGQPVAVEALKPLVEVIANQMQGMDVRELKELEQKHELELIEAQNEPFRAWMQKLLELDRSCQSISAYERCVKVTAEATKQIFGDSFQQALPAPTDKKALPE